MKRVEAIQQEMLMTWCRYREGQYPELKLLHHIPNGGSRNKLEAANLKRQGVKSGVPDLFLPAARGGYHGLYIEMKAGTNKPTANQKAWIDALGKQGYAVAVCYSAEEASDTLMRYLRMGIPGAQEEE